jgi:hypothetical protein
VFFERKNNSIIKTLEYYYEKSTSITDGNDVLLISALGSRYAENSKGRIYKKKYIKITHYNE